MQVSSFQQLSQRPYPHKKHRIGQKGIHLLILMNEMGYIILIQHSVYISGILNNIIHAIFSLPCFMQDYLNYN